MKRRLLVFGGGVALLLALPGTLVTTFAKATSAQATVPCPGNDTATTASHAVIDPSTVSNATLTADGLIGYPLTSVTALPGGGAEYTYDTASGPVINIQPPAGFQPETATAAQRAEYGIPPEPPTSAAEQHSQWAAMLAGWKSTPSPPAQLIQTPGVRNTSTGQSNNWSGYYDTEYQGSEYDQVSGVYIQPAQYSSRCSTNAAAFWVGLGGINSANFGQDGTAMGYQAGFDPLGSDYNAWFETDPGLYGPTWIEGLSGTPGCDFWVSTSWISSGSEFEYSFYNYCTGLGDTYLSPDAGADLSSADWIGEAPCINYLHGQCIGTTYLSNFETLSWQGSSATTFTGHNGAIGSFPNTNDTMVNPSTGDTLAWADNPLGGGGSTFNDHQSSCW